VLPITKTTLQDPISLVLDGNIEKVFELLEIREVLESWAAQRATEKATEEDIRALEKVVERMREDFKRGNLGDKADADFHMAIAHATHNTILSHLMATWYHLLWNCQKVSREKLFNNEENRRRLLAQHLEIFEAIRQHDKRRAGNAIRDHLLFVERELEKHLRGER
jgi:GntR family transcriptional repressor for pyruvate dehydrogenase complex